jgi:L-lysine 2,3-aminomutase
MSIATNFKNALSVIQDPELRTDGYKEFEKHVARVYKDINDIVSYYLYIFNDLSVASVIIQGTDINIISEDSIEDLMSNLRKITNANSI